MKKIGFVYVAIVLSLTSIALISSCVQLKTNSNPNDPTSKDYKAPVSNTVVRGWKIDTADGSPSPSSLRCINVPMGQKRKVHFTDTANNGTFPTGTWINLKVDGISSGGLTFTLNATNNSSGSVTGNLSLNPQPSFNDVQLGGFNATVTWTAALTTHFYLEINNVSDSDGSNTVWIDNLRVTNGGVGNHSIQFTGLTIDGDLESTN